MAAPAVHFWCRKPEGTYAMNGAEMIGTFLEFFGDRGHQVVPGSSLVPPGGDKVLFTTAGMHPLTRYLEGRPHPLGSRLTGVQRCLRTTDLDEVAPSNTGRGYVLRRLLRRALTALWRADSTRTLDDLPTSLVEQTLTLFGQHEDGNRVREVLRREERRFASLLTRGRTVLAQLGPGRSLTEADLRYLHQTHGLPPELVTELLD
jgi:alanyl-tRNA synthetase